MVTKRPREGDRGKDDQKCRMREDPRYRESRHAGETGSKQMGRKQGAEGGKETEAGTDPRLWDLGDKETEVLGARGLQGQVDREIETEGQRMESDVGAHVARGGTGTA